MEGPPEGEAPAAALAAVLKHSSALPSESSQVRGYDFNRGVDYRALLEAFGTTGFQATNFGRAVQQVNAMVMPGAGLPGWTGVWPPVAATQYLTEAGAPLEKEECPLLGGPIGGERQGPFWAGVSELGRGRGPSTASHPTF